MKLAAPDLPRLWRTLRYQRGSQIGWRVVHEARRRAYAWAPRLARLWPAEIDARSVITAALALPTTLPDDGRAMAELWRQGKVSYHGHEGDRDDWHAPGPSRLWRFERQYHTELLAIATQTAGPDGRAAWLEEGHRLVRGWERACPPAGGDAWDAYPVARRILNGAVALAIAPELGTSLAAPLSRQLRFLDQHPERHLLGNHLLCDAAALVAGAAVIDAQGIEDIGARGARLLESELHRQVLADGGYAERTVQYHAIVLRDCLWALLLSRHRGRPLAVEGPIEAMVGWLARVRRSDVDVAFLNDAAPDATPVLPALFELAALAGFSASPTAAAVTHLPDTGWTILRDGGHELWFEHGPLGPDEQPGHGHSDALSYELSWDGLRVVTDTGVSTYAVGPGRAFERSACAHATVTVDGEGPDELWASFRAGGRGRVEAGAPLADGVGGWTCGGAVTSFRGWRHERRIRFSPGRALVVTDVVSGTRPGAAVVTHVPLDPRWRPEYQAGVVTLRGGDTPLDIVVLAGTVETPGSTTRADDLEQSWVGAGFGHKRNRATVAIRADPTGRLVYAICRPGVAVRFEDGQVVVDGRVPVGQ